MQSLSSLRRGLRSRFRRGRSAGFEAAQCFLQALLEGAADPITSPTDFIEVVSVVEAPGNFSNAKRGILVTT